MPSDLSSQFTVGNVAASAQVIQGQNIRVGPTAKELVAALEAEGFLRTAQKKGIEQQTIIKLAQRMKPDEVLDFEQAIAELKHAVTIALDVIARGEPGANQDDFLDRVLARVAATIRVGDLDDGASAIDDALTAVEANYRRSRVTLLEEAVQVEILRRDAAAVVRRVEALIAVDQPTERIPWSPLFRQRYNDFFKEGEERGLNFSLAVAIEFARRMVATAHNSDERGDARNLLGIALRTLGERESGTARLAEAVVAYRAALEELTRERVPLDWAVTQNNLGNALSRLGDRESGTARLEEAVVAYSAALEERTRERMPLDWAMTQDNLGNALSMLGERESGTARLEEAVVAYRAALEELTRERVPLDWATTQNNLGTALAAMGERESGTARLEEAVVAYRTALEEWTRERAPHYRAMAESNLNKALAQIALRTGK